MHEAGIMQTILHTAFDVVKAEGGTTINSIKITVGDLTDIVDDALHFSFEAMKAETMAENATLEIARLSPKSRCVQCGTEFEHGRFDLECPECTNPFCELVQGRELRIDSIDYD